MTRNTRDAETRDAEIRGAQSRDLETRDAQTRDLEAREMFDTDYVSLLDIPHEVRREGYDCRWVRYRVGNERDNQFEMAIRRGYEPIPLERVPNKYRLDFISGDEVSSKYFTAKDTVLMERPNVYTKRDIAKLNETNQLKIRSLRGVTDGYENATTFQPINGF